ncbi:MAG TPA: hypothetical protein VJV96_01795 [Candidatus Angelobacter sp.]|nr:hypothetical protein [Candidatus Angelobacter sp.]
MSEQQKRELELLKAVADEPYENAKVKWNRLLKALHLSRTYVPGIKEILTHGKWRNQPGPVAYVRKAAVHWAVRHGLADIRRKPGKEVPTAWTSSEHDSFDEEHRLISELCEVEDQRKPQRLVHLLSQEVLDREVLSEAEAVDWEKVATLAILDPGERIVLDLKLIGLSWREAIAACLAAEDRKILNTAWRRFDRHKGSVKQALLTGRPQHILRKGSVPGLELMFTEGEDGRLKIFFKRVRSRYRFSCM